MNLKVSRDIQLHRFSVTSVGASVRVRRALGRARYVLHRH